MVRVRSSFVKKTSRGCSNCNYKLQLNFATLHRRFQMFIHLEILFTYIFAKFFISINRQLGNIFNSWSLQILGILKTNINKALFSPEVYRRTEVAITINLKKIPKKYKNLLKKILIFIHLVLIKKSTEKITHEKQQILTNHFN